MDLSQAVYANTLETYLGLVQNIPGSIVSRPDGLTLVRGPGSFSFCNFAFVNNKHENDIAQILSVVLENARDCRGFCAFVTSPDSSLELVEALLHSGFAVRQQLVTLASDFRQTNTPVALTEHLEKDSRLEVTRFMARQFFGWMSRDGREAIALATALSPHQIVSTNSEGRLAGAAMIVRAAGVCGLYNLCVREDRRGGGLGSSIVAAIQSAPSTIDCPLAVLCDPGLVSWYQLRSFGPVGSISVFSFDQDAAK